MALDTSPAARHRLVTRSDFDGLVCAALLKEIGLLDDIQFVHPKDMQDGKIEVGTGDITTNLPYVPGAGSCSTTTRPRRSAARFPRRTTSSSERHQRRARGLRLLRWRRAFPASRTT